MGVSVILASVVAIDVVADAGAFGAGRAPARRSWLRERRPAAPALLIIARRRGRRADRRGFAAEGVASSSCARQERSSTRRCATSLAKDLDEGICGAGDSATQGLTSFSCASGVWARTGVEASWRLRRLDRISARAAEATRVHSALGALLVGSGSRMIGARASP